MGLLEWYPFIRKKGYEPTLIRQSLVATTSIGSRRVDVLGASYRVILGAYLNNSQDRAHTIIEKEMLRFGSRSSLVFYINGPQAQRKLITFEIRQAAQNKATVRCEDSLDKLEQRIESNLRLKKRHFADVNANFSSSSY
ncbi:hypothetical protein BGZ99_001025 [Dissophora globulifera]|uniref:Uncharacterized protein n=1 Tax=Dissophora globulifera TaxID=979702 RepID=A0A9P6R4A9_9FUNG|nr:hypothetical protein BGZ99_001025 [Dissophora globulifera]